MKTYLNDRMRITFPDPRMADPVGLVAVGGNLSPGLLLSAYEQGIFPWYDRDPIAWFSPDPRFVLRPPELHIGKRLVRSLRKAPFRVTFDTDFSAVIRNCRMVPRDGQDGTWITPEMETAYRELHKLGHAHSVEVWNGTNLVGGLYGVAIGQMFAGESMFSLQSGASKAGFIALTRFLRDAGVPLIDCQVPTPLLASFGAVEIPRSDFLDQLPILTRGPGLPDRWSGVPAHRFFVDAVAKVFPPGQ